MTKVGSLDALRGVLSLIVLAAHGLQVFAPPSQLGLLARVAVLMFFCLSGYVIAASLDANRRGGLNLSAFAAARVFRIAPPLIAIIAMTLAAHMILMALNADYMPVAKATRASYSTNPSEQFLALLTLTVKGDLSGMGLNGPLWSLAYEIRLYVVAGLLAWLAWGQWKAIAAVALACYLWLVDVAPVFDLQALCFLAFGAGSAAFFWRAAPTRAVWIVIAAGLLLAWMLRGDLSGFDSTLLPAQTALSIALAGAVLLIARVRSQVLSGLGHYSYTLYIGHFPLLLFLYFVAHHFAPQALSPQWAVLTAIAAIAITWAALAALGRWVERPKQQREFFRTRFLRAA